LTTEVLSIRVKKGLKEEAEKLGIDVKTVVEQTLQDLVTKKKTKAQQIANELSEAMNVTPEEWAADVRATRDEM
jgi:post-segregation antitoxin (ccd killing protein)